MAFKKSCKDKQLSCQCAWVGGGEILSEKLEVKSWRLKRIAKIKNLVGEGGGEILSENRANTCEIGLRGEGERC